MGITQGLNTPLLGFKEGVLTKVLGCVLSLQEIVPPAATAQQSALRAQRGQFVQRTAWHLFRAQTGLQGGVGVLHLIFLYRSI